MARSTINDQRSTGYERQGLLPWLFQRVTGALLVILVGGHFLVAHYSGRIDFERVAERLSQLRLWFWFDILLVACVSYHAVIGIRNVVLDYNPSPRWVCIINVAAVALVVLILLLCADHLRAFAGL